MAGRVGAKRDANHLTAPAADSKKPKANGSITSFFGVPKTKSNDLKSPTALSSSSNFNKQKWVASLTPEQKELLQLEIDTLDESWLAQLKEEVVKPEFLALKRFLQQEKQSGAKVFPPEDEIYSWYSPITSCMGISCSVAPLTLSQVPSYASPQSEGSHNRPRSLP